MKQEKYKDVVAEFRKKTNESFHQIEGLEAGDFERAVWDYVERKVAKENLGIEILHVILTGSRARGIEAPNSDLDLVVDYRGDVKEDVLFNLLNEGKIRVNSLDVPIDINPIRPEETGSLEEYLIKTEKYLLDKAEEMNTNLYAKWQDIAISQGYPLIIGKETVVFPTEYDDYFTPLELERLEKIMLDDMNKPKVKDFKTIKDDFVDELKTWDRSDFRKTFVVAKTSEAMSSIGIADKEITLDAVKLNRIFKYHSAMTEDVIMQLPDIINDPVFILSSKKKESRIVAAGEVFDKENNPVVVVMELEPKGKHGIALDEIKIASAYGKENIQNLIVTSEMLYLTEDKEKINSWIKCTGLQLPFGSSTIDSTYIISQNDEKATDEFKEKQLEIILEKNPAPDNYHTWIRTISDVLSYNEALNMKDYIDEKGEDFDPSYPYSVAEEALKTGRIMVYSSYPIEQGAFVTPSLMEAKTYAGNGQVYSKEVNLSDIAWIDPTQGQYAKVDLSKGEKKMGKENPISIWVGNQRVYAEGGNDGKWIELPMNDEELKDILSNISNGFRDEMYIGDTAFREDCQYLYDLIGEYENIQEINVVAKLLGDEPHPAVEMYMKYDENLSMKELANLIVKEDEIPYIPYSFDGVDNPSPLNNLSSEEKLGYTMLESTPGLMEALENLEVDGTSIINYINVNAIGRDMVFSGYARTGEEGYLDTRAISMDLKEYTVDEINEDINREVNVNIENVNMNKFAGLTNEQIIEILSKYTETELYEYYSSINEGEAEVLDDMLTSYKMSKLTESYEHNFSNACRNMLERNYSIVSLVEIIKEEVKSVSDNISIRDNRISESEMAFRSVCGDMLEMYFSEERMIELLTKESENMRHELNEKLKNVEEPNQVAPKL